MIQQLFTPYRELPAPSIHYDELLRGLGFRRYPLELLDLAVHIYEGTGFIIPQSMLLEYDPEYLDDFWKRLRISRVVNKPPEVGHGNNSGN